MKVAVGTTALQAVKQSGIESSFPETNLAESKLGIFAQVLGTKGPIANNLLFIVDRENKGIYPSYNPWYGG